MRFLDQTLLFQRHSIAFAIILMHAIFKNNSTASIWMCEEISKQMNK